MTEHHHGHRLEDHVGLRSVVTALVLISTFVVLEVAAGILGHSLALLADASHMVTDVAALGCSAWAIRLSARPATDRFTFGLERAEILSAAINGVLLAVLSAVVLLEAIDRLVDPRPARGGLLVVVALIGAVVNLVAARVLRPGGEHNLNLRGAYLHVLTDLYGFGCTVAAGVVIIATGWLRADAVASLLVVGIMVRSAWELLAASGKVLLQGSPEGLDLDAVRAELAAVDHVLGVHDLHAWSVTSGSVTISAHVIVEDHCFATGHAPQVLDVLQARLLDRFEVEHATFQLEPASHITHEDGMHH